MVFKSGEPSANPYGRPRKGKTSLERLMKALKKVETQKGKPFFELLCEKAYENEQVMIAVARKIIPDVSATKVEAEVKDIQQLVLIRSAEEEKKNVIDISIVRPQLESANNNQ